MKSQRTSDFYGGLWAALVAELEIVLGKELVRHWTTAHNLATKRVQWRTDVETWSKVAHPRLERWLLGTGRKNELARLESLAALPALVSNAPLPNLFPLLASYSFFRLLPYRRSLVWDHHSNKVVPSSFVDHFVIGHTSELASGETAFAAYASDFAAYSGGMVVSDGFRNLRGTFSLTDRILGLRSNAFIPVRSVAPNEKLGDILGIVVVSLPLPAVLPSVVIRPLADCAQKYADLLLLLLQMERGEEHLQLERTLLTSDQYGLGELCRSLVTQPATVRATGRTAARRSVPLPVCAAVHCDASGPPDFAVKEISADVYVARDCEDQHLSCEGELSCFGLKNPDLNFRPPMGRAVYGRLFITDQLGRSPSLKRSSQHLLTQLLKMADTASHELEGDGPSFSPVRNHLRTELLRDLSRRLLSFILNGDSSTRSELFELLEFLEPGSPKRLQKSIASLRRVMARFAASAEFVMIGVYRDVPALKFDSDQSTRLGPFSIQHDTAARKGLSANQGSHSHVDHFESTYLAELRDAHGFLSWARCVMHLAECLVDGKPATFEVQDGFALQSGTRRSETFVFSSLLLGKGTRLVVSRDDQDVTVCVHWDSSHLTSRWTVGSKFFPMSIQRTSDRPRRVSLSTSVSGEWCKTSVLYGDISREDGLVKAHRSEGDAKFVGSPAQALPASAVTALFGSVPHLARLVDTFALVPLSLGNEGRAMTLRSWAKGEGPRVLLFLGSLRRTISRPIGSPQESRASSVMRCYTPADWLNPRNLPVKPQLDPLIARFYLLASAVHELAHQRSIQRLQAYRRTQGGHVLHELRGDMAALGVAVSKGSPSSNLPAIAKNAVERYSSLSTSLDGLPSAYITFATLTASINPGIVDGWRRAFERAQSLNLGITEADIEKLLPLVQGIHSTAVPDKDLTDLLSNLFGNALVSAARRQGQVTVSIAHSCVTVENPCDDAECTNLIRILTGVSPTPEGKGLGQIVRLANVLGLHIEASKRFNRQAKNAVAVVTMSVD